MNIELKTQLHLRSRLVALCLFGSFLIHAQDIHFSQFYNSPLTLSPALTGVSRGDIRAIGVYRSQWKSANAPYSTIHAAADQKFYSIKHEDWWLSGGLALYHDKAGDSHLATSIVALSGSYTRMLDKENFLTVGVGAGLGQRRFKPGDLTFDNQWNGDVFDPNRPINENFNDTDIMYPDFSVGLNWRGQKSRTRSKLDIGGGLYHFSRPDQRYLKIAGKSALPMRMSLYFMPTVQVADNIDIVGHATAQIQNTYLEAVGGAAGRIYISTKKSQEVAIQLGLGYRFNAIGDAFIPAIEFLYHDIMVGLSWDVNVSGFSEATNRNGGPEITGRYIFHRVYPLKAFKACPLL